MRMKDKRNAEWRRVFYTLLIVLCLSGTGVLAQAAQRDYGQLTKQLSETMAMHRTLTRRATDYDVVFRRDPLRALINSRGELVTSAGLHGGLSVEGIIWSAERPLAVIDDELYAQGDSVGFYTIIQIRQDGVVVQKGKDYLLVPLDRGIETQQERHLDPLSLLSLPEDAPVPYAPRRSTVAISTSSSPTD